MPKDWVIAPQWRERERLAAALKISPIVANVLHNRGIDEVEAARRFLAPQLTDLLAPETLPGVEAAAERISAAVSRGEKIVIFGDYDVDGVAGVSILWHCLRTAGAKPEFYIPHRLEEGYGINSEAIEGLLDNGARLIISVDCGVTALEPAERVRQRGAELIITDHHAPQTDEAGQPRLPDALLVHPAVPMSNQAPYGNPNLSGAGVAFKLAWALAQRFSRAKKVTPEFRDFLLDATGLAALGTIADVVPLVGENRVLAHYGLRGLPQSHLPGIQALIQSAGVAGKKLDGYDIGFKLAPRLNAIGRMGHAQLAADMLTRAGPEEAARLAEVLNKHNTARQGLERRIAEEAIQRVVEEGQDADTVRAIVLAGKEWHAGVIGIVASRVLEEFGRPTILIALNGETGQGSGRSIRNFPLHEVLAACKAHLLSYGGHAMAAGVRIKPEEVDAFRVAVQAQAAQRLTPADLRPKLYLDDVVDPGALNEQLVEDLKKLEPFGAGNAHPRLATNWLNLVSEPRTVGSSGQHLQVMLGDQRTRIKGIAFGKSKMLAPLLDHRRCRVAFQPVINEWQGKRTIEMQIEDFQFPEPGQRV